MSFGYTRFYAGPVQAVIFDWAGTTIDFGSMAPIHAFCSLFEVNGVPITLAEAREPMGTEKREHISRLLALPRIRDAWATAHGQAPNESDIDRLYADFVPMQIASIAERAQLIPGAKATFDYLDERGIAIGANTGYSQEMIAELLPLAAAQGYRPSSNVCATDVPRGRPFPHMTLKNMLDLEIEAVQGVVKVDDTLTGIEEGLNAGCWTVGVAISGNEVGLDLAAWEALDAGEQELRRTAACQRFRSAGAHYVIDSVAELPSVIEDIEARLAQGEQP
ncbi:phosphonoacetaldehyde hydrolase [Marinobacterium nitratireducens]|uniref:Phosphonoacetaldehyde hydrolase n=1 Tax=Marinobacterium nitratireducens TaxID=518897 RepID=A0A917ZFM7_9GAMM|nr:phosphonoacetaldehyde hydrolase [Marinobacterium nitratireducens]GGO82293.1 phosphonoacetaldehyde hydrolase [Marinobacterium nitratireducens]